MALKNLNEAIKDALMWRAALWQSQTAIGVMFRILDVCGDVAAVHEPCPVFAEAKQDDRCGECDVCDVRCAVLWRYRRRALREGQKVKW